MVYLHFFYDPDTIHTLLLPVTIISAKWRMYAQRKRYRNLRWAGELVWGVSSCQQTDAHTHNSTPFPTFTPPLPKPTPPPFPSHFTLFPTPTPLSSLPLLHPLSCTHCTLFPTPTHSTPFPTPTHSTLFPTPFPPFPSHFVCHSLEKTDCSALCP